MKLILMRHGLIEPSTMGAKVEQLSRISERDIPQKAEALREQLEGKTRVLSSPKSRACVAAKLVCDLLGLPQPQVADWLNLSEDKPQVVVEGLKAFLAAEPHWDNLVAVTHEFQLQQLQRFVGMAPEVIDFHQFRTVELDIKTPE